MKVPINVSWICYIFPIFIRTFKYHSKIYECIAYFLIFCSEYMATQLSISKKAKDGSSLFTLIFWWKIFMRKYFSILESNIERWKRSFFGKDSKCIPSLRVHHLLVAAQVIFLIARLMCSPQSMVLGNGLQKSFFWTGHLCELQNQQSYPVN